MYNLYEKFLCFYIYSVKESRQVRFKGTLSLKQQGLSSKKKQNALTKNQNVVSSNFTLIHQKLPLENDDFASVNLPVPLLVDFDLIQCKNLSE